VIVELEEEKRQQESSLPVLHCCDVFFTQFSPLFLEGQALARMRLLHQQQPPHPGQRPFR
jgi:hypothetical protein